MQASMEAAGNQGNDMIEEYKAQLQKIYEDHKSNAQKKAALQIKMETDSLERSMHKDLSKEQIQIKRELSQKQAELKEKLFDEVQNLLQQYRATPAYKDLLIKQIKAAKNIAQNEKITIYLDPADASDLADLVVKTGIELTVSEYSFLGGTRAVIHSKNILIDNSFESKLSEEKDTFTFTL